MRHVAQRRLMEGGSGPRGIVERRGGFTDGDQREQSPDHEELNTGSGHIGPAVGSHLVGHGRA
jgi:hypothetical protein